MLSIQPIGSSSQQVSYYTGFGREDYYCDSGEPPGVWFGTGQNAIGVSGQVQYEQFGRLLTGMSADGTRKLVQNAGRHDRRSAFDLTFSVPKSVSVAWGLSKPKLRQQIEQAAERAVWTVMGTAEEFCGISRRGKQGQRIEKAKLLAALFRHNTSRGLDGHAPDPNLHWHCVLLNLSVRPDGTTGSLDARELFRPHMKMALGALFRTELAKNLGELGLECYRPIQNEKQVSWFELRGVPTKLIKAFSKRRSQIEAWLDERGLSGAKASERAAQATRRVKQVWSREQLDESWRHIGVEHGFSPEKLLPRHTSEQQIDDDQRQDCVMQCVEKITETQSYFTQLQVIRHVAEVFQTRHLGINDVKKDVANALNHDPEIVRLQNDSGIERFTTQAMLKMERQMLDAVDRSRGQWIQGLSATSCDRIFASFPTLRAEQHAAIEHVVFGGDSIACVNGKAGTGKTFMLSVAHEVWKAEGHTVIGTALAATAAANLEAETGVSSIHLHSLLKQIDTGQLQIVAGSILLVDEAGMLGTRMVGRLVQLTEQSHAKLVLVGDYKQLQAIDAGGPFRAVIDRLGVAELNQITRQKEKWARQAVTEFSEGNADSALARYFEKGLLTVTSDRQQAMQRLVDDWGRESNGRKTTLILAGSRLETTILNRLCQEQLFQAGKLSVESIEISGERFHVGDHIVFTRNNQRLLVRNGSTGTLAAVDGDRNQVVVDLDSGLRITVDLTHYSHLALGYAVTTHKSQGLTVDSAFVLAGGGMTDRELTYVQTSRARGVTRIYTDEGSAGEDLAQLARQMTKSRAKDLAHDYVIEAV